MSDGRKYYCFCEDNCKFETMTKEQILAAIAQAVKTGSVGDCDTGFITKVKEQNGGSCVTFWVGTQAQYYALETKEQNCLYILTDDTTGADILKACKIATDEADTANQLAATANATATAAGEAAATANATATAAAAKAGAYNSVDFTGSVYFSWVVGSGGENLTSCELAAHRFEYNPCTGIVHFLIGFYYSGKLEKGEIVEFSYGTPYGQIPTGSFPFNGYGHKFTGVGGKNGNGMLTLEIRAEEDIDTQGGQQYAQFCGWYFEGVNNGLG